MNDRHTHDWRREGPLRIRTGGVRERCPCGRRRTRRIVRCPDCADARLAAGAFTAQPFPCETCDARGWVDAPAPDPTTLCCCYRFDRKDQRCGSCRYKAHAMEVHVCELLLGEADAAYHERELDALLEPPRPLRVASPEAVARVRDMGF
jgi:hypothetical protein